MAKVKRGMRLARRQADALKTRARNVKRKDAERNRRDARMLAGISAGSLPYTPEVMSWLSRKLGKPSRKITQADIKTLTA